MRAARFILLGLMARWKVLSVFFLMSCALFSHPACAGTYLVTTSGDDVSAPPMGSLRSVLNTIKALGAKGDVIQFASDINEIELKGTLEFTYPYDGSNVSELGRVNVKLDGYTGRKGKRVTLTLAKGGYHHLKAMTGFSANGIVFKGFGKNDPRNIPGEPNGGVFYSGIGATIENCTFIDIVGKESAVIIINEAIWVDENKDAVLYNCLFERNYSEGNGGALSGLLPDGKIIYIQDCFMGGNKAAQYGGAITGGTLALSLHNTVVANKISNFTDFSVPNIARETAETKQSSIRENKPFWATFGTSNLFIKKCRFLNNESEGSGGGFAGIDSPFSEMKILNSTFYANAASVAAGAINSINEKPPHYATLFAGNDTGGESMPTFPVMDERGNLYADGVAERDLTDIFGYWPPIPELQGGYIPLLPIQYAGPAEGKVSSDIADELESFGYEFDFKRDARGVQRDYLKGASVGAYEFGTVALLPGNVANSTTLNFSPNATRSVKVKLLQVADTENVRFTNYLSGVPVEFQLVEGNNLGSLPRSVETADNGRASATIETGKSGKGTVKAFLKDKPSIFLDMYVKINQAGENASEPEEELYVVALSPSVTKIKVSNVYFLTFSGPCRSSTVSTRRKGYSEYIEKDVPVVLSGDNLYGEIGKTLNFPEKGTFMLDFKLESPSGRVHEDTKELKVNGSGTLIKFILSQPPYHEDKELSVTVEFEIPPKAIDISFLDENGTEHKSYMRWQNERLSWEGRFIPAEMGHYQARLWYTDAGDGMTRTEKLDLSVEKYSIDPGERTQERSSGSGCNSALGLWGGSCLIVLLILRIRGVGSFIDKI